MAQNTMEKPSQSIEIFLAYLPCKIPNQSSSTVPTRNLISGQTLNLTLKSHKLKQKLQRNNEFIRQSSNNFEFLKTWPFAVCWHKNKPKTPLLWSLVTWLHLNQSDFFLHLSTNHIIILRLQKNTLFIRYAMSNLILINKCI